ncbi:MAG: hypothetical protein V3V35_08235 [Dehalococcoidia bacterium]
MRRLVFLALAAALAWPLLVPSGAVAQDVGVIEGRVVNGTPGGPDPGPVPLSLLKFRRMTQESEVFGQADAQGQFRFEGLEVDPDVRYFVQAGYRDVAYRSPAVDLAGAPGPVEVQVFETTTSDAEISIRRASVAIPRIESEIGLITVLEVVTFVNEGDRTYVGNLFTTLQDGGVVRIPLPASAVDVSLGHGFGPEGVQPALGGMIGQTPFPPGELELVYAYGLPYTETEATLRKLYFYPVRDVTVLVPEGGPQPTSPDLEFQGIVDVGGTPQMLLTRGSMAPGDTFTLRLTNLPRFAAIGDGGISLDSALRYTGVALLFLVVGAVITYTIVARRRRLAPAGVALDLGELERERADLVTSLAELEEAHEGGVIADDEYQRLRRRQRNRLTDVLMLMRESSGEES